MSACNRTGGVLPYLSRGEDAHQVLHSRDSDRRLRVLQTEEQRRVRVANNLHTKHTRTDLENSSRAEDIKTTGQHFQSVLTAERALFSSLILQFS